MQKNIALLILLSEVHLLTDKSINFESTGEFVDSGANCLEQFDQFADKAIPTLKGVNIGLMSLLDVLRPPKV
jgi:hypothetical protein